MNTAIYIRVSTEEQANEGFSIKAQQDKLTKYSEINDYNIVDYYIDDGISGKTLDERPEVTRLISDIKEGLINNVLVYKLDRLTRSLKDLIYLIELFDKYNCTFNSQTEKIDTSNAVGRMFVKIIGIFAEFERENLAERISFGYEQKTKEGNYTNCNGVFGYDYIVGKGKLVINEEESYYVRKIYEWYLEGNSMLKISRILKELNVPTKRGGSWNQSTINSILNNPLYIGKVRYGINKKNNFEVAGKDINKIIDTNLFDSVQQLLNRRKKVKERKFSSDDTYYYKILKCSYCNSTFTAKIQFQKGKKYITYRCSNHNKCNASGFSHKKIEESFLKYLENIGDFKYNDKVLNKEYNKKTNKINCEIEKLKNKRNNIIELFSIDKLDSETFEQIKEIIDIKIDTLSKKKLEFKDDKMEMDEDIIKEIIINLKNNYIKLNNNEKKIFLERFVKEISVKKEKGNIIIESICFN